MNTVSSGEEISLDAVAPELVLALAAVAVLLLGSWLPRRRQYLAGWGALASVVAALILSMARLTGPAELTAAGTFSIDVSLNLVRIAVLAGTAVVILLAGDRFAGDKRESEFYVLLLLAALGTLVLAGASDLLVLGAGYLLASIPLYALAGYAKDSRGTEGMLKYYLMGALFGVLLLFGIALLLGAGGSTSYADLARTLPYAPTGVAAVGLLSVAAGLLFKAGAVPAHFWVPDAIDGTTGPAAAFISTIPKVGALVALFRISSLAGLPPGWPLILALLAAATMTLGNLAAFFQDRVLRLLAYSTISQVGYLLMIVAAAGHSTLARPSLLFYLLAYTVTNLGVFAVVCAFPDHRTLNDYTGLFRRHRWLSLSLIISLLGLIGTPPTAVFVGKLTAFTAALDAGLGWLVILALANSVASVFYYLRWIHRLFQAPPASTSGTTTAAARTWGGRTAVALAILSLALGLSTNPLLRLL
ncbi:NADH-quinone oxidoreductase subunit N [Paenarthrobacter sp. Z7-10]|uniref:NADH-quinone oxidoreductase subunit N n=1 Tax=Paenarthrobacter sp. Z7-10 TaxID=2787635 RepID=UPI0022A93546|nr:NADH-quinone oxidoreductase subunit N [Paenarthrobacter sp. Z7-10]MCZ2402543.1 NADH-quinone oxidoreductase subunit N [Paenarthrobacter sp. Z7-10]